MRVAVAWVCLALAVAPLRAADEVIDRVMAVAAGEIITLSDVRTAVELGRVQTAGAADPTATVLTQLIDRALVLAEVNRFAPPEPAPQAVDAALDGVVARFASAEAFDSTLARLGVDRPYVRELLREDLRIRTYLNQRFTASTAAEQQAMVEQWVAGLRRRDDVVNLYDAAISGSAPGTAAPAPR
jgi:hypothetical protein